MAYNQWNNSPPSFTEFGPLSSDVKPTGNFITRLLRRNKDEESPSPGSSVAGSIPSSREASLERQDTRHNSLPPSTIFPLGSSQSSPQVWEANPTNQDNDEDQRNISGESDLSQGQGSDQTDQTRTLSSVLSRLGNILDRRSATPQTYKDSDWKQYWMPDSSCRECYDCGDKFTTFRRRHHCRICGQIFCSKCCNQELPGKIMGYRGNLRVCTYCCKVVLSCVQQSGFSGEYKLSKEDLRSLPQAESLDGDSGSYQEFGWWTPVLKKPSIIKEESKLRQRSSSSPDLLKVSGLRTGNPFDFNPHMGLPSAESMKIERKLLVQDSQQLKDLWRQLQEPDRGIQLQSHRIRLRMYTNCIVGTDIIAWLEENKSASRDQAVAIGQALLDASFLEPINAQLSHPVFRDNLTLYKPGEAALHLEMSPMEEEHSLVSNSMERLESMEPLWVQEIDSNDDDISLSEENKVAPMDTGTDATDVRPKPESKSVFYVGEKHDGASSDSGSGIRQHRRLISGDRNSLAVLENEPFPRQDSTNTGLNDEFLTGTLFTSKLGPTPGEIFMCPPGWRSREQLRDENGEKLAFDRLQKAHQEHMVSLVKQLLSHESLSLSWADTILRILLKVTDFVRPDVRNEGDDMDIRKYVQIKKIPGSQKHSTALVNGVVCTKNIAHKKMQQFHSNPKILLLKGSVEYQRVENKFSSLEPQILQEKEFLMMSVAKITALRPDVVLVEKTVSRLAQEFLLQQGITLCFNIKPSVMERVARFTQASIVNSIDGLVSRPMLGFCHSFKVKTFHLPNGDQKTLMYFDGCATHLGCTITLRGGSYTELKRVKKILQFMTLVTYHSRLEVSFCMDEFALPPPAPDELSLQLEGLDSSNEVDDGRQPIFSPQSNLSSIAIIQLEVATELQYKSDPMAEQFLAHTLPLSPSEEDKGVWRSLEDDHTGQKLPNQNLQESQGSVGVKMDVVKNVEAVNNENSSSAVLASSSEDVFNEPEEKREDRKMSTDESKNTEAECVSVEQCALEIETETNQDINITAESQTESGESNLQAVNKTEKTEKVGQPDLVATESNKDISPRLNPKEPVKRKSVEITELKDFSDPLQNYQKSKDESIFDSCVSLTEHKLKRHRQFRKVLDGIIVGSSPYLKLEVPYLETESGSKCELRKYFPGSIYWSSLLDPGGSSGGRTASKHKLIESDYSPRPINKKTVQILSAHRLILSTLDSPASDRTIQAMLSDFRARGGRILLNPQVSETHPNHPPPKESFTKGATTDEKESGAGSQSTYIWEKRINCLDPRNHQKIGVLFSSYSYVSANAPYPCVSPWVVNMDFYGRNDITLGGFLERFCFRETYTCPSEGCETSMVEHIRRFVHENGCIYVILRKLENLIPGGQTNILMWSWCRKCKQVTPVVPMSIDTWCTSFAKYLDMRFHGNVYRRRASAEPCIHSLHHEHYQYFGFMDTVASFKYSSISLREIALPPLLVNIHDHNYHPRYMVDETKKLTHRGSEIYNAILEHMVKLKNEVQIDTQGKVIADYMAKQQAERAQLRELAQAIQHKLEILQGVTVQSEDASADQKIHDTVDKTSLMYEIMDDITRLKTLLTEAVLIWNTKIQEFIQQQRKLEKSKSQASLMLKKEKEFVDCSTDSLPSKLEIGESGTPPGESQKQDLSQTGSGSHRANQQDDLLVWSTASSGDFAGHSIMAKDTTENLDHQNLSTSSLDSYTYGVTPGISAGIGEGIHDTSSFVVCHLPREDQPDPKVTLHFTDGPCEVASPPDSAVPESSGKLENEAVFLASSGSLAKMDAEADVKGQAKQSQPMTIKREFKSSDETDSSIKVEKRGGTVKNILSNFLSGPGFIPVTMPFSSDEHHTLPPCDSVPIVVYDHEPSSIVAYSLSCRDYHLHLQDLQAQILGPQRDPHNASPYNTRRGMTGSVGRTDSSANLQEEPADDTDGLLLPIPNEGDKGRSSKQPVSYHIELQFADNNARFYCRVYFAEQFRQLRKLLFPAGEDMFIRSLSRCVAWKAKGGKSGSAFCKTSDDRFILKQMSGMEVESFEKFAPHYFQYITDSQSKQKPTALAKILGVYRIGFRNTQTNTAMKQDLLVMENLFYDRKISQTFDLKGSVRNRLVKTTGKREDELVLLDENLLKASVDQPLYIRQHSKAVLNQAIARDTQFLSSNLVMDYSLLVGLDDVKKDLVVGIIDYIRTFTWDKKLEMVVKYTGIFGGQGKMPTVVSPELYKSRFLEAMDRYFLLVPDRWSGLGRDSEKTSYDPHSNVE